MDENRDFATFGGGCFWCTEAVFSELEGVASVEVGYSGGTVINPNYYQVSKGTTGHAEVVRVEFDPKKISYPDLLAVFFATHDPTKLNRQGADVGSQYRSVIFYHNLEQRLQAQEVINHLNSSHANSAPIITELRKEEAFYPAETEHRQYYQKNTTAPYCQFVINPKLDLVKQKYFRLLKKQKNEK